MPRDRHDALEDTMRQSPRRLLLLASALAIAAVPLVPTGVASAAPDYRVLVFWGR